ncbi:MAG: putative LPS assembly protein LptD [Bacteroidales bacterium]
MLSLFFYRALAQVSLPLDSAKLKRDTIKVDTIPVPSKKNALESPVSYSSKDSLMFSVKSKSIFAYGDAKLGMDDMKLDAGYIKMDIDSNYLYAKSITDKNGEEKGKPVFSQGDEKYDINTIKYNLKTKKSYVTGVATEMGGGYMQAKYTKMMPNKEINLSDGKFSTCDAEHPHFYVKLTKAKVIPGKKIISGPFYFVISDIPIPVGLPFGYFPDQRKRTSGIILPTYGEEKNRGFYMSQGGYYFALSDYVDLTLLGEIYTSGSWGLNLRSNYKKRYKFAGNMNISYNKVISGEKDLQEIVGGYSKSTAYSIQVAYTRDPKSIPNATFNTSINYQSSNYAETSYNSSNQYVGSNDRFKNSTSSSIAYTKSWPGTPFNFSANMSANQNLSEHQVNLDLPTITLNMTTQHPLKNINKNSSKGKWYKELSVGFSTNMKNTLNTKDSLLFTGESLKKMSNGLQYKVPVGTSIKLFKYFNFSPSFSFTGRVYTSSLHKYEQLEDVIDENGDTIKFAGEFITDTVRGLYHVYDYSFGAPVSTKIYGMLNFKKGKIAAIRHVMTPSVSFNYKPDFAEERFNFYDWDPEYPDDYEERYDKYANGIYGSASRNKTGSIGIGLDNNLEMKTHTGDTAQPLKKIVLLSRFGFNTSYNLAKKYKGWQPISIGATTKLFKQINTNYSSVFQIYDVDSTGKRTNDLYFKNHKKLGHFDNHSLSLSGSVNSDTFKKKKGKNDAQNKNQQDKSNPENSPEDLLNDDETPQKEEKKEKNVDADGYSFSLPWNLSINYTFRYTNTFKTATQSFESQITQSMGLNGSLTLTDKWNLSASMSYDFKENKISSTNINISRDLHCWTMGFNCIPFGKWQSYSFRISIKSSMLKGMEYKKQKSWADNF